LESHANVQMLHGKFKEQGKCSHLIYALLRILITQAQSQNLFPPSCLPNGKISIELWLPTFQTQVLPTRLILLGSDKEHVIV